MIKHERQLALDILIDIYKKGGYSNLSLAKFLPKGGGRKTRSNSFVTALVYGIVERDLTLSYLVNQHSKKPCDKLDIEISLILKMGLYQILYMNSVPDNAAVDEAVKLCYYSKKVSAKGFVNGVLRAFIRDGKSIKITEKDDLKALSIAYSCPLWLIKKWTDEYSYERTKKLLQCSLGRPPFTIRVNTLRTTAVALTEHLRTHKIEVTQSKYDENCLMLENTGSIERLVELQEGFFYVQDLSSQLAVRLCGVKPGDRVFDICSAPGSKSFTMAQYMQNKGEILAFDLHEHKLELIEKTAQRLHIENIKSQRNDATIFCENLAQADVVLCDVPCSGLGIIRRKPEIKYKAESEIERLPELQLQILQTSSRYVKPGGRLIYSTCALNKFENEGVAEKFLAENPEFSVCPIAQEFKDMAVVENDMATFFPDIIDSDGFFAVVFCKQQ